MIGDDNVLLGNFKEINLVLTVSTPNSHGKEEGRSDVMMVENDIEVRKSMSFSDNCHPVWFAKAHCLVCLYRKRTSKCLEK